MTAGQIHAAHMHVGLVPNLGRVSEQGIVAASPMEDVSEQMLLPVVGGEDGDLFGGVAQRPHVHERGHDELRLGQVLVKVGIRLRFADPIEVLHVDHLID